MNKKESDTHGAKAFLEQAYQASDANKQAQFYSKWASQYDAQMVDGLAYRSPQALADLLMPHLPNQEALILDIGCGTGLTVQSLYEAGFTHLHGLDRSLEMLTIADVISNYFKQI